MGYISKLPDQLFRPWFTITLYEVRNSYIYNYMYCNSYKLPTVLVIVTVIVTASVIVVATPAAIATANCEQDTNESTRPKLLSWTEGGVSEWLGVRGWEVQGLGCGWGGEVAMAAVVVVVEVIHFNDAVVQCFLHPQTFLHSSSFPRTLTSPVSRGSQRKLGQ